ncbi:MAG TPA: hypothetical protein IAA34_06935 [Candidatus Enterococcus stercoripullorum]|nr:hypothetical protein [Candidatus Enterococcus stercoripullorum]
MPKLIYDLYKEFSNSRFFIAFLVIFLIFTYFLPAESLLVLTFFKNILPTFLPDSMTQFILLLTTDQETVSFLWQFFVTFFGIFLIWDITQDQFIDGKTNLRARFLFPTSLFFLLTLIQSVLANKPLVKYLICISTNPLYIFILCLSSAFFVIIFTFVYLQPFIYPIYKMANRQIVASTLNGILLKGCLNYIFTTILFILFVGSFLLLIF